MKISRQKLKTIVPMLEQVIDTLEEKCGGPGSGVPGPCPATGSGNKPSGGGSGGSDKPSKPTDSHKPRVDLEYGKLKPEGSDKPKAKPATGKITGEPKTLAPPPVFKPNVDKTKENGITESARVGVPGDLVPPKPPIGNLPNLTPRERRAEKAFNDAVNKDPDGMASKYREKVLEDAAKEGKPPTFETDAAKNLTKEWTHPDQDTRLENRSTLNVALHQAANAVAKRAFLQHLDTLKPGDEVLITCGGCGAGKGFCLGKEPNALEAQKRAKAVWDAAGDQNATENEWIQKELEKRGLKGTYFHVSTDPKVSWADEKRGVAARAGKPDNGRMVDAQVFADSYAIGNRNHQAFYEANKKNPNASFIFVESGATINKVDSIPKQHLEIDRHELANFARDTLAKSNLPSRVKRGGSVGQRVWPDDVSSKKGVELIMEKAKEAVKKEAVKGIPFDVDEYDKFETERAKSDLEMGASFRKSKYCVGSDEAPPELNPDGSMKGTVVGSGAKE